MSYKQRQRSSKQRKPKRTSTRGRKRGLVRAGATLVLRGISRAIGSKGSTSRSTTKRRPSKARTSTRRRSKKQVAKSQRALVKLAKGKKSGEMVLFDARVVKTLPDDIDGDQHQRFLIAIDFMPSPIQTVLIAHNIDLAPRVPVERGSVVRFYGQYEWNEKGGLLHWTHHDPSNWREGGWIELHGKRYD